MNGKGLRIAVPLIAVLSFVGLVCDEKVFAFSALLLILICLYCFAAVVLTGKTMKVSVDMSDSRVHRGDDVDVNVTFTNSCILPGVIMRHESAIALENGKCDTIEDDSFPCARNFSRFHPCHASHVGEMQADLGQYTAYDFLGIFSYRCTPEKESSTILVLPRTFDVDELSFSPGDSGLETMARATEDVSNPSEIRSYQPGDPLKKIHWKLSLRKRELMVRRFEEPVLQEALVLLDCSKPDLPSGEESMCLRDTMLETAASLMEQMCRSDHAVRLPLLGTHPVELEKSMGMMTIAEDIARCDFSQEESFERVLLLETRRIRKIGATVVISSHLNGNMVDVMVRMRRMGPTLRFYYVTFTPDSPEKMPMIGRLQSGGVQVMYVTPCDSQEVTQV